MVIGVKNKLKGAGYYQEPEWGISRFTDNQMFEGIRKFQKDKGLTVDGVMKPEGETETKINEVIKQKNTLPNNSIFGIDKDKEIRDRMYPVVKGHEKNYEYPYKDTKGNITVGIGSNVDNKQKFDSVDWQDAYGRPISRNDAERHYQDLTNTPGNMIAYRYKDKSPLRILPAESRRLYDEHINNDLGYLRKTFPDFDNFNPQMQDVFVDMKYNTGNIDRDKWPNLHQAIINRDLEGILNNVHRKDIPQDRNDWALDRLREIRRLDY